MARTRRSSRGCATTSPGAAPDAPWRCSTIRGSAAATTGRTRAVTPFWEALHAAGADLVLNGHDHDYERFAPQDPAGGADPERGITQLIVGTGGAELREFKDPVANSRVRASIAHGVLSVTLRPSGWAYRFDSVDGSFTDQGAGTCH